MKTTTFIVVILFLIGLVTLTLFGIYLKNDKIISNQNTSSTTTSKIEQETTITNSNSELNQNSITTATSVETSNENNDIEIEKIQIYLDGAKDKGGIFLGEAKYGLESTQTANLYGEKFKNCGFSLDWDNTSYNFIPGSIHTLYVYAFIPKYGWQYLKQTFTIPGEPQTSPNIKFIIDTPPNNSIIDKDTNIGGWAVNTAITDSPGISNIDFYIDGPQGFGKLIGSASLGSPRQDVAQALNNAAYTNCGFNFLLPINLFDSGTEHLIYAYAKSTTGEVQYIPLTIKIAGQQKEQNSIIFVEDSLVNQISNNKTIEIKGWAISKDLFKENVSNNVKKEFSVKKIIFTSLKTGNEDIFSMNIDGSDLTQLTNSPSNDMYPQITPDGKKILYTSDINGTWQIMIMNTDGTDKKQLTNNRYRSGYATMSFDGKYIFYEVFIDNNWEIFRMNSDGSNSIRLTFNPTADDWHPVAHPFEFKILYESGAIGSEDIYFMNFDGTNITKVSDYPIRKRTPCISSDGNYIAFAGFEQNKSSIFLMNSDGSNVIRLTDNHGFDTHPSISPDNMFITFDSNFSGNSEIYIMNFDGPNLIQLTNIPGDDWGPVFLYQ